MNLFLNLYFIITLNSWNLCYSDIFNKKSFKNNIKTNNNKISTFSDLKSSSIKNENTKINYV